MAMTGAPADEVVSQFVARSGLQAEAGEGELVAPDHRFFETLVLGVDAHREALDDTVRGSLAEDWPFERLEILVRLILEAAAFEITGLADVPPRVTLDEYMNVANAFYGGAEPGFINGVLDAIAHNLRPAEMTR
jgi:N utilization substance protein B